MKNKKTPKSLGFFMPAEWEKHDAIWLAWPHDKITFPRLNKVENAYANIIKAIHKSELVNLFVKDEGMRKRVKAILKKGKIDLKKVKFWVHKYADVWFRDYGPIFIVNREKKIIAMTKWIFNSWGNKYKSLLYDNIIPNVINQKLKLKCFKPEMVLEGGSVDVNGKGTLLTVEGCLLNKNRNPKLKKKDAENYLCEYLGVSNVIWLKEGLGDDGTDGHIDVIARFVDSRTVVCAFEDDPRDKNYKILKENYEILRNSKDQDGKPLRVIKLPMPDFRDKNGRLPASYANFYIGNRVVLVPVFMHKKDKIALKIFQELFPNRKVAGIDCRYVVYGLGTLHCISQQQPSI